MNKIEKLIRCYINNINYDDDDDDDNDNKIRKITYKMRLLRGSGIIDNFLITKINDTNHTIITDENEMLVREIMEDHEYIKINYSYNETNFGTIYIG